MRCGVVIFDDVFRKTVGARKRASTNGWAAIDGAPARRIVSVSELESDVKWWTNFDFTDFNAHYLGRNPNIFFSGFLRTEFKSICQEIGCGVELEAADAAAQSMSVLFGRIARLAVERLKIRLDGGGVGVKALSDLIAAKVVNKNKLGDELNAALQHAYQAWTSVTQRLPKDWKSATLRKPRYTHALDVLSTPVPSEHRWRYVDNARMPAATQERIDWCLTNELPVLANVVVKPRRGDFTNILSYNAGSTVSRTWVCQPELLFLTQMCDVEVIGAFICEAGFEHQNEIDEFPTLGDFSLASYSLGLLAENIWVSMASPRTTSFAQKYFVPRAVWYRAIDRVAMFMYAARMHAQGFQISGYGNGSLIVCYPAGATEDLISAATDLGLDIPVTKFAEVRNEVRLMNDE